MPSETSQPPVTQEDSAAAPAIRKGRYRHFKGNDYEVIDIAYDSETREPMVIYRALYGEHGLWVRPAKMFAEIIERNGVRKPRFEYIGER